jgi:hypothetical protein
VKLSVDGIKADTVAVVKFEFCDTPLICGRDGTISETG